MHCSNGLGCVEKRRPLSSQKRRQRQRGHCFRWLQPCVARTSDMRQYGETEILTPKETSPQQKTQLSFSLEVESPEIVTHQAPHVKRKLRMRRGFRVYHRPVSATGNYYSLPFPAPEQLKLESDGDSKLWQDVEVRVISHEGLVVWQDLQTLSDDDGAASVSSRAAPQRRKFGGSSGRQPRRPRLPATENPPQSPPPPPLPPHSSGSADASKVSALLTIEATIHHRSDVPQTPKLQASHSSHAPCPLASADAFAHSHQPGSCAYAGDRRPVHLVGQLRHMQQIQQTLTSQHRQQLMKLRQRQPQWRHQKAGQSNQNPGLKLAEWTTQSSRIPRLLPNWSQQQQPVPQQQPQQMRLRQLRYSQWLRRQDVRLNLKEQDDLRQREAATRFSIGQVHGKRRELPSYMRPYSPVLHYPTPSKLSVSTRHRRRSAVSDSGRSDVSESYSVRF